MQVKKHTIRLFGVFLETGFFALRSKRTSATVWDSSLKLALFLHLCFEPKKPELCHLKGKLELCTRNYLVSSLNTRAVGGK